MMRTKSSWDAKGDHELRKKFMLQTVEGKQMSNAAFGSTVKRHVLFIDNIHIDDGCQ